MGLLGFLSLLAILVHAGMSAATAEFPDIAKAGQTHGIIGIVIRPLYPVGHISVSYTHLTLPTIYSV